jgi:hypothetical protein
MQRPERSNITGGKGKDSRIFRVCAFVVFLSLLVSGIAGASLSVADSTGGALQSSGPGIVEDDVTEEETPPESEPNDPESSDDAESAAPDSEEKTDPPEGGSTQESDANAPAEKAGEQEPTEPENDGAEPSGSDIPVGVKSAGPLTYGAETVEQLKKKDLEGLKAQNDGSGGKMTLMAAVSEGILTKGAVISKASGIDETILSNPYGVITPQAVGGGSDDMVTHGAFAGSNNEYYIYREGAEVSLATPSGFISYKNDTPFTSSVAFTANTTSITAIYEANDKDNPTVVTSHALTADADGDDPYTVYVVFDTEAPELTKPDVEKGHTDDIVRESGDGKIYDVFLVQSSPGVSVSGIVTDTLTIEGNTVSTGAITLSAIDKGGNETTIIPKTSGAGFAEFEHRFSTKGTHSIWAEDEAGNKSLLLTLNVGGIGTPIDDLYNDDNFEISPPAVASGSALVGNRWYIYAKDDIVKIKSTPGALQIADDEEDDGAYGPFGEKIEFSDKKEISVLYVSDGGIVTRHAFTTTPAYFFFDKQAPEFVPSGGTILTAEIEKDPDGEFESITYDKNNEPKYVYLDIGNTKGVTISGIVSDSAFTIGAETISAGSLELYCTKNAIQSLPLFSTPATGGAFDINLKDVGEYEIYVKDKSGNRSKNSYTIIVRAKGYDIDDLSDDTKGHFGVTSTALLYKNQLKDGGNWYYIYPKGTSVTISGIGAYSALRIDHDNEESEFNDAAITIGGINTSVGALYVQPDNDNNITTLHAITTAPAYFLFDNISPTAVIGDKDYDNNGQVEWNPDQRRYFGPLTVSGIASDPAIVFDGIGFDGEVAVYYTTGSGIPDNSDEKILITSGGGLGNKTGEETISFSQYFPKTGKYAIWAEDSAGNKSAPTTFTVYIDDQPPSLEEPILISQTDHSQLGDLLDGYWDLHRFGFGNFFSQAVTVTVSAVDMPVNGDVSEKSTGMENIYLEEISGIAVIENGAYSGDIDGVYTRVFTIHTNAFDKKNLTVRLEDRNNPMNSSIIPLTSSNTRIDNEYIESDEFTMDTTNPLLTGITVSNQAERDLQAEPILVTRAPIFIGSASDDRGLNRLIPQINTVRIADSASGFHYYETAKSATLSGNFTLTPGENIFSSLTQANPDGSYVLTVTAIDNAGNKTQRSQTAWYDATKPNNEKVLFEYPEASSGGYHVQPFYIGNKSYGYFYQNDTTITVSAVDEPALHQTTSGIRFIAVYGIDYSKGSDNPTEYRVNSAGRLVEGAAASTENVNVNGTGEDRMSVRVTIPKDFKGQIYAVATDRAGNTSDVAEPNEGSIVESGDQHKATSSIALSLNASPAGIDASGAELPLYDGDVKIDVIVKDAHSGVKTVTWHAIAPDRSATAAGSYEVNAAGHGSKTGNGDDWKVVTLDKNLATEVSGSVTVSKSVNSNNIKLLVKMTDNAGNSSEETISFSIDTTDPVIGVTYDNNDADQRYKTYYKAPRTATVVVTERNFRSRQSEIIREIERMTDAGAKGRTPSFGSWSSDAEYASDNKTLTDATTHTFTVRFADDGDYTFDVGYTDLAGNKATSRRSKFTVDRTRPVVTVSYDKTFADGNYYSEEVLATVTVEEHNFDSARVDITPSNAADDDGGAVQFPEFSSWSTNGNTHTATLRYGTDALYSFDILVTDKAGNQSVDFPLDEFYVDLTDPEVTIGGIGDHQATNADEIQPTVRYFDENFDESKITMELTSVRGLGKVPADPLTGDGVWSEKDDNGGLFTLNNFPEHSDDIYTLTATLSDKAGHEASAEIIFSVNRDGSTYMVERGDGEELVQDAYYNKLFNITVTEVNVNDLLLEKGRITHTEGNTSSEVLFENGVAREGVTVAPNHPNGNGAWTDWSETVYNIPSEIFSNEVQHDIFIESEDVAANKNDNKDVVNDDNKYVSFTTDLTPPDVVVRGLPDGRPLRASNLTLVATIEDKVLLNEKEPFRITLNGKPVDNYEEIGGDANVKEIRFEVDGMDSPQSFAIEARDEATNQYEYVYPQLDENGNPLSNFVVSTNPLVLWFYNRPVFIASIAATAAAIALLGRLIYRRRRLLLDERAV